MSHPSPTLAGVVHWMARCEHPGQALGATCEMCGGLVIDEICELCEAEAHGELTSLSDQVESLRTEPVMIEGRTIGCSMSGSVRPFAFPFFTTKETAMKAHEQYKLIEATGRLLLAGAEVVELPDGRKALALPGSVAVSVLRHVNEPSALDREVMTRMGAAAHS